MANGSNRDVNLTLNIGTLGEENVAKLKTALTQLADEGGKGAEDFTRLANEIGRLGDQNQALQSFKALSERNAELKQNVDSLGAAFDQLKVKVDEAKGAQETARAEVERTTAANKAASRSVVEIGNDIKLLKANYEIAKISTEDYKAALIALVQKQGEARLAVKDTGDVAQTAKSAYNALGAEVRKLESQYNSQDKALSAARESLRSQTGELQSAAQAAQNLGLNVFELGTAEASLAASFSKAQQAAIARKQSLDEMAEADRLAGIEAKGMAALIEKGRAELLAEEAAFQEATAAAEKYAQAKAAAQTQAANWQQEAHDIVEAAEARRRLTTATERQIEVQHAANAAIAENARNLEAAKQDDFAATVRILTQELERLEAQELEAAAATQRLNSSFTKLDTRPISEVQLEIANVRVAMANLASSGQVTGGALAEAFAKGENKIKELEREIRQLNGTMTLADRTANVFKNSMGQIAAGNLVADAIGNTVEKVKELGREFVVVIAKTESLRRGLMAVYKDTGTASSQFEFLRSTAQGAGISMGSLQSNFLKFSAAMQAANVPLAQSNALFASVTKAAASLGLGGEEVSGMLEALGQMASKGTVSMEELRQQLGDRLPGAMSLVAKGLGITEAQLIKLVESGSLAARDVIPALTKSLGALEGDTDTLTGTWERFKGVLQGVAQDAGDAGWLQILTGALKVFGGLVGHVALGLSVLWEMLRMVGVGVVALAAAFTEGPTKALEFFNEEVNKSVERLTVQEARLRLMLDPTDQYAKSIIESSKANEKLANSVANATSELAKIIPVSLQSSAAIQAQAAISNILADKTKDVSAKIVSLSVVIDEQVATLEKRIVALTKEAKALQENGAAQVALATIRGDELGILQAQTEASVANAEAAQKVAAATQLEVDLLTIKRNAIVAATLAEGESIETRKQILEDLDKKIEKSRAENSQAQANIRTLEQERFARKLAAETYGNQSAQLESLSAEYEQLSMDIIATRFAFSQGTLSAEQLRAAEEKLAAAAYKQRDALADRKLLLQSELGLATTKLQLQKADLDQQAAAARASGNLVLAVQKEVESRELQIKILKLKAAADEKAAKLDLDNIESERRRLEMSGQMTDALKTEIEIRLNNAKAKQLEAGASKAVIEGLEQEIRNLRQYGNAAGNSISSSMGGARDAVEGVGEAARDAAGAFGDLGDAATAAGNKAVDGLSKADKQSGYQTKDNMDHASRTGGTAVGTRIGIIEWLKGAGLTEQLSEYISRDFVDAMGNVSFFDNAGQKKWRGNTMTDALAKAVDFYKYGAGKDVAAQYGGTQDNATTPSSPTTTTPTASGGTNVTIVIGSKKTNVKVASRSDASALEAILRELENAKGTAI